MIRRPGTILAVAAFLTPLLLTGCIGFSRQEPAALFPADSLSRELARTSPRDTLRAVRHISRLAFGDSTWLYIASLRFRADGRLVATDLGRALSYVLSPEGEHLHTVQLPGVDYPYLLSADGDTLVIHDAGTGQVVWITGDQVVRRIGVPASTSREALSVFAALSPAALFIKKTADPGPATLLRYDIRSGRLLSTTVLEGPVWKYRGPMIPVDDSILSVSAFLPQVHVFSPNARVDSLRLVGFDSPALHRTRLFVLGKRKDPPLLIPAVAAARGLLFVLNARPDRVRIDVYDRSGHLVRILEEAAGDSTASNPVDLAAFPGPNDSVTLAVARVSAEYGVLSLSYQPRISLYRWDVAP